MTDAICLTVADAAKATGLSAWAIREAYRSGALPVRYHGTKVLIKRTDLEGWIDALPDERETA